MYVWVGEHIQMDEWMMGRSKDGRVDKGCVG